MSPLDPLDPLHDHNDAQRSSETLIHRREANGARHDQPFFSGLLGNEEDDSGLSLDRLPSGITFYRADRVGTGTFVAAGAKLPGTITVRKCPQISGSTVDVSFTLNVAASGQSVQIPVGASNVPVK